MGFSIAVATLFRVAMKNALGHPTRHDGFYLPKLGISRFLDPDLLRDPKVAGSVRNGNLAALPAIYAPGLPAQPIVAGGHPCKPGS